MTELTIFLLARAIFLFGLTLWIGTFFAEKYPQLNNSRFVSAYIILALSLMARVVFVESGWVNLATIGIVFSSIYFVFCLPWRIRFPLVGRFSELLFCFLLSIALLREFNQHQLFIPAVLGVIAFTFSFFLLLSTLAAIFLNEIGFILESQLDALTVPTGLFAGGLTFMMIEPESIIQVSAPFVVLLIGALVFLILVLFLVALLKRTEDEELIEEIKEEFQKISIEKETTSWEISLKRYIDAAEPTGLILKIIELKDDLGLADSELQKAISPLLENANPSINSLLPLEKNYLRQRKRHQRLEALEQCRHLLAKSIDFEDDLS